MSENEKQLINPKVLMDAFRRYMVEHNDREKCASEENCKTCERRCLWQRIVNDVPTVDAVEVVHGRWMVTGKCNHKQQRLKNPEKWVIYSCSVCMYSNGRRQTNYCPDCGAKMDGDGNG